MIKFLERLYDKVRCFLNPHIESKRLYEEIGQQRMKIKKLIEEYHELHEWSIRYIDVLDMITSSVNALIWKKDKDKKYLLANPLHCRVFYGMEGSMSCLNFLEGKTDVDLINLLYRNNGIENTFGEICLLSDGYTEEKNKLCHFIEGGIVDGNEVLLYVIKIPVHTNKGEFNGTIGLAWDITNHSKFILNQLQRWLYDDRAEQLYRTDNVFVYCFDPVVDTCSIFHHICSDPKNKNKCNQGNCEECLIKKQENYEKYNTNKDRKE